MFTHRLIAGMLGRTLNTRNVRRLVSKRLPVLNWLPYYKPSIAVADLVAGITVGLTLIPQAIAYASLAGLHAQVRALTHEDR
jgi:sodium-independent sulfate anion transporter 11